MIYLMWIYNAWWIVASLFMNIYVYSFNKELLDVFVYNLIFILSAFLIFVNLTIFTFNFNIFWYIIYTLILLILNPLYRVSEHVFDLKLMDTIKVKWSDFFPAMILREIPLWIWRIVIIILFIFLVKSWIETENILKIGLLLVWIFLILAWWSIALHMKYENKVE